MVRSLLAPGVSSEKTIEKKIVAPVSTKFEPECEYTRDEKTYIEQKLESKYKTNSDVSFLRPNRLSDCINLLHQGHKDYHKIDSDQRKKAFGKDDNIGLVEYMKIRSKFTNWADPMAKCDFEKIVNDDVLKDVLDKCTVCTGTQTDDHKFVDVMACYDDVKNLNIVKMEEGSS